MGIAISTDMGVIMLGADDENSPETDDPVDRLIRRIPGCLAVMIDTNLKWSLVVERGHKYEQVPLESFTIAETTRNAEVITGPWAPKDTP